MFNSKFYAVMIVLSFIAMAATVGLQVMEILDYGIFTK